MNRNKKKTYVQYLLISILFLLISLPSHSKIYKRIHKDGTIEYYNRPDRKPRPRGLRKTNLASKYDPLINAISKAEGLDPYLVKCIIKVESDFVADAVSEAGAMGLMQLMQETARYYDVHDPLDPEENLRAGIKHFRSLMNYFKNDIPLSLAAYHAGLGRVRKRMAIPPIKSTIKYVNKIMRLYNGKKNYSRSVKKLYKRIDKDGDIIIYSK